MTEPELCLSKSTMTVNQMKEAERDEETANHWQQAALLVCALFFVEKSVRQSVLLDGWANIANTACVTFKRIYVLSDVFFVYGSFAIFTPR